MPVISMATGDIQLPAVETAERKNGGIATLSRPINIPKIAQINMGFMKFFKRCAMVGLLALSPSNKTAHPKDRSTTKAAE